MIVGKLAGFPHYLNLHFILAELKNSKWASFWSSNYIRAIPPGNLYSAFEIHTPSQIFKPNTSRPGKGLSGGSGELKTRARRLSKVSPQDSALYDMAVMKEDRIHGSRFSKRSQTSKF